MPAPLGLKRRIIVGNIYSHVIFFIIPFSILRSDINGHMRLVLPPWPCHNIFTEKDNWEYRDSPKISYHSSFLRSIFCKTAILPQALGYTSYILPSSVDKPSGGLLCIDCGEFMGLILVGICLTILVSVAPKA